MNRTARWLRPVTLLLAFTVAACGDDGVVEPTVQPIAPVLAQVETSVSVVNLHSWAEESYGSATWTVAHDGSNVLQSLNGDPTFFYGEFPAFKTEVEGVIRVETTGDDDFIGFALGFEPGDTESPDADYLLVDWKKGSQAYTFSCTNTTAFIGLSVSRVTGAPSLDELWGHQNLTDGCVGETSGVEELARANTLGSTGWVSGTDYRFSFQFTATLLRVYVDDVLELEVNGEFSNGRLGFYNFSQSHVRYSAFTLEEFNTAPTATDDAYELDEDEPLEVNAADGVLANDTDPDADDLTVLVVDEPENGAVTLNSDGSFDYTPSANYHGPDAFTYRASDGDLQSDPAKVQITIFSVNDSPVANSGGPYAADEGSSVSLAFEGSDADGDLLTYTWDFGDGTTGSGSTAPANHTYADNGLFMVTLSVEDGEGSDTNKTQAQISNVPPEVGAITIYAGESVLSDPIALGSQITMSADFTDPGLEDTHTGTFDMDITESSGATATATISSGVAEGTYTYPQAGVYVVQLTVTDDDDASGQSPHYEYVVVFDPDGGSVTGNGSVLSPATACSICNDMEGSARFGFTSGYKKPGATAPSGNTRFQFTAGGLRFRSHDYDWLVVSGPKAQFKGWGTINGAGEYGFLVTANDGERNGGGGVDRFRIKIWDRETDLVVYDNQVGDGENADATTAIESGKIVIRSN